MSGQIEQLAKKLDEIIYEEGFEGKVALLKQINSHADREQIYGKERLVSAILRTLSEASAG